MPGIPSPKTNAEEAAFSRHIAAECARIRSTWSDEEHAYRAQGRVLTRTELADIHWTAPLVDLPLAEERECRVG